MIYWRDIKLSAVVLGVCLMTLLTLSLNTFIHTLVLIQLSFLVVTLTYIVTKIAIDSFYNRDIANPFKLVVTIDTLYEDTSVNLDTENFDGEFRFSSLVICLPSICRERVYVHIRTVRILFPGQLFKANSPPRNDVCSVMS